MTRWFRIGAVAVLSVIVAGCASTTDAPVGDGSDRSRPTSTSEFPTADGGSVPASTEQARPAGGVSTSVASDTTVGTTTVAALPAAELAACAAALPIRERIALLVWPAVYSDDWDTALRTVQASRVGGVVLMEPVGWSQSDLTTQLARLDAATPRGLVIATDEEGGVVQRLSLVGELPSQQTVSEDDDLDAARQLIAEHGQRVAATGVDMVLGPVVDVVPESGDVPLSPSRFFTGDPTTVEAFGRAYIAGWRSSGLATVIKHYPGHGAASADTHDAAATTPSLDELERRDLVPFRGLADTGTAVMVGHLTVPGLTDGLPATQSERAVRYLRDEIGYGDALVITDALGMQAVGLAEDQAAVQAILAGIDVVIFTATGQTTAVIDAIERAVADGTLSEERITLSAARVLRVLDADRIGCGSR